MGELAVEAEDPPGLELPGDVLFSVLWRKRVRKCHALSYSGHGSLRYSRTASPFGKVFAILVSLLQNYKNAVTPAEAGVQKPLTSLDSCFRRNDRKKQG